ncbi:MAG: GTPase HflX [Kiritimatiellae bacterium]|nr:GTPase HflX [Kiritimatiellia bacterium]
MTIDLRDEMEERALLVQGIVRRTSRSEAEGTLNELHRLAVTAGASVVGRITQRMDHPTSNFYVGQGKLNEIKLACKHTRANLIIFDNELSSVQVNNLDLSLGIKVIDRTELILQIFARRASSAESQLQVELAQLQYLVSRIPISAKQQRFEGGIGMRGPGESPFQLRNAPMRKRITAAKRKLAVIQQRRRRTRKHRALPLVALVGYTNAGKSTLLNALSPSNTYVDDRLFATLDTKTSMVHLPDNRDVLVTDTVGFIRNLPHGLVASFRSTLEEATEADLLLVVADGSHKEFERHTEVVRKTLQEIEAATVPSILVLNKMDRGCPPGLPAQLKEDFPFLTTVSALKKQGLEDLRSLMAKVLPAPPATARKRSWRDY